MFTDTPFNKGQARKPYAKRQTGNWLLLVTDPTWSVSWQPLTMTSNVCETLMSSLVIVYQACLYFSDVSGLVTRSSNTS